MTQLTKSTGFIFRMLQVNAANYFRNYSNYSKTPDVFKKYDAAKLAQLEEDVVNGIRNANEEVDLFENSQPPIDFRNPKQGIDDAVEALHKDRVINGNDPYSPDSLNTYFNLGKKQKSTSNELEQPEENAQNFRRSRRF